MSTGGNAKADNDNKSNQCNPNNDKHQGHTNAYGGDGTQKDKDNHGNQMNPNNATFKSSREGGGDGGKHQTSDAPKKG